MATKQVKKPAARKAIPASLIKQGVDGAAAQAVENDAATNRWFTFAHGLYYTVGVKPDDISGEKPADPERISELQSIFADGVQRKMEKEGMKFPTPMRVMMGMGKKDLPEKDKYDAKRKGEQHVRMILTSVIKHLRNIHNGEVPKAGRPKGAKNVKKDEPDNGFTPKTREGALGMLHSLQAHCLQWISAEKADPFKNALQQAIMVVGPAPEKK